MKKGVMRKGIVLGIIMLFMGATLVFCPVSAKEQNAPTDYVWKWGQQYDSIAGDVTNYGSHAIRMGEQAGGTDGTAYYTLDTGCINGIKDNTLKVGIYFCDWGWFGDGPTVSIFNYVTSGYEVIGADVGNNDQMQWWWSGYINPPNKYADQGKVKIKVWAEADDDTILEIVNVTFEGIIIDPPHLYLDADYINFGTLSGPFPSSSYRTVNLHNDGGSAATGYISITGSSCFTLTSGGGQFTIPAGDSRPIKIAYTPTDYGQHATGTLVVNADNCDDVEAALEGWSEDTCCFPTGTKITMADGSYKNIEDIRPGHCVLSYNIETGRFTTWRVKLLGDPVHPVYEINNGLLSFTKDHPVYIKKPDGTRGWGAADIYAAEKYTRLNNDILTIEVGDQVYTADGEWIEITSIEFKPEPIQTYNIMSFCGTKTYFANDVLVFEENPPFSVWRENNFYIRGYLGAWIETILNFFKNMDKTN
jgi:hypothetical protein